MDIRSYTKDLEEKRKERSRLETDRQLFVEMQKNLVTYQLHYDNMEYTKKALSASKGIPTLIVKHYLRDTESITNELLDIAYDGEVRVEPFDISADTFSIPVWIHGARRPDVKLASQGEVAFLSVALSFALISQSLGRYNIMSLDEVDGPLDRENRQKFIDILENQIERVGSEQNFLITHNEIFATYPVIAEIEGSNQIFNIVFFITLLSLVIQGMTISKAARLLHVDLPAVKEGNEFGVELPENIDSQLKDLTLTAEMLKEGNKLKDMNIPQGTLVMLIKRDNEFIIPNGQMELHEGDKLLIISEGNQPNNNKP